MVGKIYLIHILLELIYQCLQNHPQDLDKNKDSGLTLYDHLPPQSRYESILLLELTTNIIPQSRDELVNVLKFKMCDTLRDELDCHTT